MSKQPTHATTSGRVYLALRKAAQAEGRSTDEFLQLHALEAFVHRLSASERAGDFVLKGGVLLSAYDVRRPTRDVDLSSQSSANSPAVVEAAIGEIAVFSLDDGWVFSTAGSEIIREDAAYSGVRVTVRGVLASARQEFHVDVSFGDPISPAPGLVVLPRLLGGHITVAGYPLSMVLAEKLITALQRGTANTRWRDYADIFLLSRAHAVPGNELADSLVRVARARGAELRLLSAATLGYTTLAQGKWAAWVRKQKLAARLPLEFAELLAAVVVFSDPVLEGRAAGHTWEPAALGWK